MIPTLVGFVFMALLAMINRLLGGSILYPPAQFTLLWSALLGGSLLCSNVFFSLSTDAVLVFCLGALAFTAGGALRLAQQRTSEGRLAVEREVINTRFISRLLAAAVV